MRSSWLYQRRESPIHRLHPLTKLLGLLLCFVAAFAFNDPRWLAPYLAVALALIFIARVEDNLGRASRFVLLLFFLSVLLWTFFVRDVSPSWQWGPLAASPTSFLYGLAVGLRLAFLLLMGLLFLSTTTIEDAAYAMRLLRMPEMMLLAFTLAFRLVPTFLRSAWAAAEAQCARGLELNKGGPWTRLRLYVPLMMPVLARGLRSADDLTRALETRGISTTSRRTHLKAYTAGWADFCVVAFLAVLTTGLILARVYWHMGELLPRL